MKRLFNKTATAFALAGISAATAAPQSTPGYTTADVHFMQGMIGHHAQALAMTALIPARSARGDIRLLGQRIEVSQKDEIKMMQQWLADRHQQVPNIEAQHGQHAEATHSMNMPGMAMSDTLMPGMLTTAQLAELAGTKGSAFDKLFLKDMIQHHEGALVMVANLLSTTGSGQEPEVFRFAAEVDTDQRAEITRMNALLDKLGASGADTHPAEVHQRNDTLYHLETCNDIELYDPDSISSKDRFPSSAFSPACRVASRGDDSCGAGR